MYRTKLNRVEIASFVFRSLSEQGYIARFVTDPTSQANRCVDACAIKRDSNLGLNIYYKVPSIGKKIKETLDAIGAMYSWSGLADDCIIIW